MCCFSGPVEHVSATQIFARATGTNRQVLVYQMQFAAREPVAMILPLPVPKGTKEDAVRFINLEKYENFFADLKLGFPAPKPRALMAGGGGFGGGVGGAADPLPVVRVGKYTASFVPTIPDFERLDEQFRLPQSTWNKLPIYKDHGFAVFQLDASEQEEEQKEAPKTGGVFRVQPVSMQIKRLVGQKVHPMAFDFPTKYKVPLFFPTVHIHDGKIYSKADFDHTLYLQVADDDRRVRTGWRESDRPAEMFMSMKDCEEVINPKLHCYRKTMSGKLVNEDTLV